MRAQGVQTAQRKVRVVVQLDGEPAVETYIRGQQNVGIASAFSDSMDSDSPAAVAAATRAQISQIASAQARVSGALSALGAQELYRTQRVLNSIAVVVDADKVDQISQIAGVKAVTPLVSKSINHTSSVPLIKANEVWKASKYGVTGDGIRIGIIDTGIDYKHTMFGGNGNYDGNDPTVITDNAGFPSAKVVGGFDFAGDAYDAASDVITDTMPVPDPDPMDCADHGTHVAGTTAGFGVNADGTTYAGGYSGDLNFSQFRIGPGVAPRAKLYALKVFGCTGSTDLTDVAIEWAMDPNKDGDFSDRLDVINMSLGSSYGSQFDTSAIASNNAARAGVIVVASSGNAGDTYFITGSPATADWAISVAATQDALDILDGVRVNPPSAIAGVYPASQSANYTWSSMDAEISGKLVVASNLSGCKAFSTADSQIITGNIVLLNWTHVGSANECGSATRVNNAAAAGAKGAILVFDYALLDITIAGSTKIPSVIVPKSVGDILKGDLANAPNVTLTPKYNASQKYVNNDRVDVAAGFTSRGVRRFDGALKPDLAAPGVSIFSAYLGTGNQGVSFNGTSMAAPHVAGEMALLKQLHPNWSVEDLKALAMNTANHDSPYIPNGATLVLTSTTKYSPQRVGAGRVDVESAAGADVVAMNDADAGRVSVSFGMNEVTAPTTLKRTVRVVNHGTNARNYNIAYRTMTDLPGAAVSVSPATVNVPANGAAKFDVTLTLDPAALKHTRDNSVDALQANYPRQWLSEESGVLELTGDFAPTLRVPLYAAARAASQMMANGFNSTANEISLKGTGVNQGATSKDDRSLVTALELQNSKMMTTPMSSATVLANAKMRYIGISSDYATTSNPISSTIYFGIATEGNWTTPNEVEFDIYIDVNHDGDPDYVLFNWNYGSAISPDANDVFLTALLNLSTDKLLLQDYLNGIPSSVINTALYNSNVMVLPVSMSDLGLTQTTSFDYEIVSYSREIENRYISLSSVNSYDVAKPLFDMSGGYEGVTAYVDMPNATIPMKGTSFANLLGKNVRSSGVLLFHHLNQKGAKVEVLSAINSIDIPLVIK
jgi:subtilisin family serine protease